MADTTKFKYTEKEFHYMIARLHAMNKDPHPGLACWTKEYHDSARELYDALGERIAKLNESRKELGLG